VDNVFIIKMDSVGEMRKSLKLNTIMKSHAYGGRTLSRITPLSDGRVEVIFDTPLKTTRNISVRLILLVGWARGSEILVKGNKIIGIRCYPDIWKDIEATLLNR